MGPSFIECIVSGYINIASTAMPAPARATAARATRPSLTLLTSRIRYDPKLQLQPRCNDITEYACNRRHIGHPSKVAGDSAGILSSGPHSSLLA